MAGVRWVGIAGSKEAVETKLIYYIIAGIANANEAYFEYVASFACSNKKKK